MANFEKGPTDPLNGWTAKDSIQVVTLNKSTALRLAWFRDLELKLLDDNNNATDLASDVGVVEVTTGDMGQDPCPIKIAGKALGHRRLAAFSSNPTRLQTEPLKLIVTNDEFGRAFDGKTPTEASMLAGVTQGSFLEAVVRVAEDQMGSGTYRLADGKTSDTHGGQSWLRCVDLYHGTREKPKEGQSEADANNWCGWFVQWCYAQAARLTGKTNPYPRNDNLASGMKAAAWATVSPDLLILNWANPTGVVMHDWGKGMTPVKVNMVVPSPEILKEGDVCLVRSKADPNLIHTGWKHVAMVHDIDWGAMKFSTLDGNAGGVAGDNTTGGLIGINRNKGIMDTVPVTGGGTTNAYKYVFLHVNGG